MAIRWLFPMAVVCKNSLAVWIWPFSMDWGVLDFAGGTVVHINAGIAGAADGAAGMAMLTTQIATATAATVWMLIELFRNGKVSALGIATGAVAGLVAITPASGSAGPLGAILIGAVSAMLCYYTATKLKQKLGYDDSLDVFGVHGIGGIVGALLAGVCASEALGGAGMEHGKHRHASLVSVSQCNRDDWLECCRLYGRFRSC